VSASPVLEAALVVLSAEPAAYDESGRAGHLTALILDEIARAPATAFALPYPPTDDWPKLRDGDVRRLAALSLERWKAEH
jgi:hypothetical protein